jgi:hypothetical protein
MRRALGSNLSPIDAAGGATVYAIAAGIVGEAMAIASGAPVIPRLIPPARAIGGRRWTARTAAGAGDQKQKKNKEKKNTKN